MSNQNIYVSDGTCYSAAGKKLDGSFIPCGNDAFGHQTCCGAGDNCLADNACFGVHGSGYGSYLTYMAGCSDPDYTDSSCPDKEGIDQPWIAVTLCDDSDGVWAACSQEGNPTTLQPGSYCSCTDTASATIAFSDSTSLTSICSLPQSTGASIQFFAGHIPSSPSSAATTTEESSGSTATATNTGASTSVKSGTSTSNSGTSASSSGSATQGAGSGGSSLTATQTGTSTASPSGTGAAVSDSSTSSSNSSGSKIGIGVGVALGGLLLVALLVVFFLRRRKRRGSSSEIEKGTTNGAKLSKHNPTNPQRGSALSTTPRASEADGQAISEADGKGVSKADKLAMAEAGGQALVEADGKPVSKADKLPILEAGGQAVYEADGRAVRPWTLRSELEGSPVVPNMAEHPGLLADAGDAHRGNNRQSSELSPVAEFPGTNSRRNINEESAQGGTSKEFGSDRQPRPNIGGLSVVGPEGTHPPGIRGAGYRPVQGEGRSRWGEAWRLR